MKLTNTVGCPAGWTVGFERDGRELLVVAIKATYDIPTEVQDPKLSPEQVPLVQADEFTGTPGESAPRCETDFAHRKLACDVLLVGSAYAPNGRPATRVPVELTVGPMAKRFIVVGNRRWQKNALGGVAATDPEPFMVMPFSYDVAFGGTDHTRESEGKVQTYLPNPVGKGYWIYTDDIDGQPLPNTEQVNEEVDRPDGKFAPMGFGPIGRNWSPRLAYVGTYDQHWMENEAPFWPKDFDHRYFQAAPPSQVIPYPVGGEAVVLKNLTPTGICRFNLPMRKMPVTFFLNGGAETTLLAEVDTVFIEPNAGRFCLVWRANLRLERSIFDVKETFIGDLSEDRQRARRFPGKPYYRNLGELMKARRRKGEG